MTNLQNLLGNLKGSKKYEPVRQEGVGYSIIFPELNGLGVMVLNLLLYRLNNINERVVIYLQDNKSVTTTDVSSGLYRTEDVGSKRAEVIRDKYVGNFSNVVLVDIVKGTEFTRRNTGNRNLIYIDLGKKGSKESYENFLRLQDINKFGRNNAYIRYRQVDGESDAITLDLISMKRVKSTQEIPVTNSKITKKKRYIKNNLTSVVLASIVNNLVTEGMDLNFVGVTYGVKTGTQKEYID